MDKSKQYSTVEKYQLIKTLGQGAFSKVKLGVDTQTGKRYAVKIHRIDRANFDQSSVDVI